MIDNLFNKLGYSVVNSALSKEDLDFLVNYVRGAAGPATARAGDALVPHAPAAYADPVMETLLEKLLPTARVNDSETGAQGI